MADEPRESEESERAAKRAHAWRELGVIAPDPTRQVPAGIIVPTPLSIPFREAIPAIGPRDPVAGASHWIATGPRNAGGRVSALAIDPRDDSVLWACAASGGVFKSTDRGETWQAQWHHDQDSLGLGAIAISPVDGSVYVATGEPSGGEDVPGAGIWRLRGGAGTWELIGSAASLNHSTSFEALAAHPTRAGDLWAAGAKGVFRTRSANDATAATVRASWDTFDANTEYSDAAFGSKGDAGPTFFLYL